MPTDATAPTTLSPPREPLWQALARKRVEVAILVCMNLVYFVAYFQRVAVPGTIFNELQADFAVSAAVVASLGALHLYLYGGMQLFVGLLTDRFGALRMLLAGGALLAAGALAFPLSNSLPMLYGTRALVGLGDSLVFLSVAKGVDLLFAPLYFPQLLAISQAAGNAGGLAGTFPLTRAVDAWGWRPALLGVGVLTALATLACLLLFRRTRFFHNYRSTASPLIIARVLRNRAAWPMLIAGPLNFGVYFLIQASIGKKFLTDFCGVSSATAAAFTFLMMLATMIIGIVGAFLVRLFGDRRKPFIVASVSATAAGVGVLTLALHLQLPSGWFLAGFVLMGFSAIGSALGNALMKELNPPEATGTVIGLVNSLCYFTAGGLITASGLLMDRCWTGLRTAAGAKIYPAEAYSIIFLLCLALAVAAVLVALLVRETHGRPCYLSDGKVSKQLGFRT